MKPLLKTLLLMFVSLASTLSQAAVFSLNPSIGTLQVGEQFDVAVWVQDAFADDAADELLGFGFNTELSGTGDLQLLGSTISPLFEDVSSDLDLAAAGLAFPALDANTAGSPFTLATLHFQALQAGEVLLAVGADLADPNQGLIFLHQGNLAIGASLNLQIAAVQIPTTAWIFMSGLIALGAVSLRPIAAC